MCVRVRVCVCQGREGRDLKVTHGLPPSDLFLLSIHDSHVHTAMPPSLRYPKAGYALTSFDRLLSDCNWFMEVSVTANYRFPALQLMLWKLLCQKDIFYAINVRKL